MAYVHGKTAFISINANDLSAYCSEVSLSRSFETAEVTTIGDSAKEYILGLADGTISISGKFDGASGAIDALLYSIYNGAVAVAFEYRSSNAAVGAANPKFTGNVVMTSYEVSASVGDAVSFSAEFQLTGAVTRATS